MREAETMMAGLLHREPHEPGDVFHRLDHLFDEWTRQLPMRSFGPFDTPSLQTPVARVWGRDELIQVDEYRDGDDLVVRAELPGVNPDEDVTISIADHRLHIEAHRREKEETKKEGFMRRELRYGSFSRDLPLPEGVTEADISATYTDGVLEIRAKVPASEATTIPVERT